MKKALMNFLTGTTPKLPAAQPTGPTPMKRAVWRISDRAPKGEWVGPDDLPEPRAPQAAPPPEGSTSSWMVSSMDLLNGTDVSEDHDTAPDELFDDVNARQRKPQRD